MTDSAVEDSGIGLRIKHAREDADMTQEQLRKAANISLSLLTKIETGTRAVTDAVLLSIAQALGLPVGNLADQYQLGAVPAAVVLRHSLEDSLNPTRRNLLAVGSAAAITLATQWAAMPAPRELRQAVTGERPVGLDLVELLEDNAAKISALATIDRQYAVSLIDSQLDTVTRMLEAGNHDAATGVRLHVLAAQLGQTSGWTKFDVGAHADAYRRWTGALHAAHQAGDPDLGASVLADFAYQATWLTESGDAVAILDRTISRSTHPTVVSLLHLRRARAYALSGNTRAALRDLSASETLLGTYSPDPVPVWCRWMSPADIAIDSGRCLLDLGDTRAGLAQIDTGLGLLPGPRAKTTAIFQTYRAEALARTDEPEEATALLTEALDTADRIGATRCVDLARRALPAFARYQQNPGVARLRRRLAA